MSILYERIKALADMQGLTMYSLAHKIGINPSRFTELKKDRSKLMTAQNLYKIAEVLHTTPANLLYGDDVFILRMTDSRDGIDWKDFLKDVPRAERLKLLQAITESLAE